VRNGKFRVDFGAPSAPRIAPHGPSSANRAGPLKIRGALQREVEVPGGRIATPRTAAGDEGPHTHADGRRGLPEILSCDIAHHRASLAASYVVLWSGCGHRDRLRPTLLVAFLWSFGKPRRLTFLWSSCGLAISSRMTARHRHSEVRNLRPQMEA